MTAKATRAKVRLRLWRALSALGRFLAEGEKWMRANSQIYAPQTTPRTNTWAWPNRCFFGSVHKNDQGVWFLTDMCISLNNYVFPIYYIYKSVCIYASLSQCLNFKLCSLGAREPNKKGEPFLWQETH